MGKTDNNMNENQKQLYSYIKDQGATDLSIDDFYAAYGNNPDKAKNVFNFVNSNEMTDLNESDFFNAYFGEVKKKVTSEPVGDTKDTTASTTEQAPLGPISSDSQQSDPISERGIGFENQSSAPETEGVTIPLRREEEAPIEYNLQELEEGKEPSFLEPTEFKPEEYIAPEKELYPGETSLGIETRKGQAKAIFDKLNRQKAIQDEFIKQKIRDGEISEEEADITLNIEEKFPDLKDQVYRELDAQENWIRTFGNIEGYETEEDFFEGAFGSALKTFDDVTYIGLGEFVDDLSRAVMSGRAQGNVAQATEKLLSKGSMVSDTELDEFIKSQKQAGKYKMSAEMRRYIKTSSEEGGFYGMIKGLAENPKILLEVTASSLASMAANKGSLDAAAAVLATGTTAGATIGSSVGGAATAPLGGVGAIPGLAAGAATGFATAIPFAFGAASTVLETGSKFSELLSEELNGNEFNRQNIRDILNSEESYKRIRNKAIKRGLTVGLIDTAFGLVGGAVGSKMITKGVPKGKVLLATSAIESTGGATSEVLGTVAIGETPTWSDAGLEFFAEAPGGVKSFIQSEIQANAASVYKINGNEVSESVIKDVIETMSLDELAESDISIEKDENLSNDMQQRIVKGSVKEKISQAKPDLNNATVDKIADLQMEADKLENNKTQAGKQRVSELNNQMKDLEDNPLPEEAVAEETALVAEETALVAEETAPVVQEAVAEEAVAEPKEVRYEMNKTDKKIWRKDFEIVDNRNGKELGPPKENGKWVVVNKVTGQVVIATSKRDAQSIIDNAPADPELFGEGQIVDADQIITPETGIEITEEATPVAEAAPVAPVVEEVISEVTEEESSLQSEIEDFDSQIEDLDGEIGSVKSETKEGIAKIDSEIKKVRASKIDKESKAERIEELKYEKIDLKEDQRTQIDSYKDDISILKKDRKKSERKLNKIIENKTAPVAQETTNEEITIFRGQEPKKDAEGNETTAHKLKDEKWKFGSAKIEGTDGYKGDKPIKKFTIPAGATIETVKLPGNTPAATSRVELETEAIGNSTAQVVKLETIDAGGIETQYIIKDDSILESGVDMTTEEETSARESAPESTKDEIDQFIEEQAESLEKELTQRNPNFQLSQDESSEVRKEKLKEEALERFSEQDTDTNTEKAYEIEETPLDPVPVKVTENLTLADKIKKIKLKDIIGKKFNLLMADKLKVELKDPSKPYNEETNPYEKMGGMFFPLMDKMFGKVAWASIDRSAALKIVQGAMEGDASAVYNMGDSGVDSNIAMAVELDKKIPESKKKGIYKSIRNRILASDNKKVKKAHKYFKNEKTLIEAFESISNDSNDKTKLSVDERAAVMRHILPASLGVETKIELFKQLDSLGISLETLRDIIGEQAAKDLPIGAISMILEVTNSDGVKVSDLKKDIDQKLKNGEIDQKQYDIEYNNIKESAIMDQDTQTKEGIPTHNNYPVYIRGRALGMMEETASIKDVVSKFILDIAEKITGVRLIKSGKVLKDATKAEQVIFDKIKKAKKANIGGLKKIAQDILDNDIKKLKKGEVRKNSRKLLKEILQSNNLASSTIILNEFEIPFARMVKSSYGQSVGAVLKSAAQTSTTSYEIKQPVISNYKQFVNRLTKAFPGVEVMEDQKSFDELVNSIYAKKLSTKNQKIYGAVYNGKLYLNPAFKNFNTPIHEFGHIWINTVKTLKPELYSKGLDLVQGTEYETSVRNNKDYKRVVDKMRKDGATQEQINTYILEEALAIAIGDKGESFVNASVSRDFKNWLEDLYNNIKKMMGISKYTSEQLENITLDEFVQAVSVDLLSGEKLFDSQVEGLLDALQLMTAPNGDSIYDIIQYGRSKEYPDSVIRKTLIDKKFKVKDIDAALEINLDIFTKVPVEFQRVADGAKSAVELFEGVKKQLDKFINENKKASITKVREQGIKILKSNPIFKEQNAQVKMELIDGFNRSINLKKGNLTFQKKMANLRNSIKDRVKGSKDLAKVHASMKRMVLSNLLDLKFSKYQKSDLNKIFKSIGLLDIDNIKIKSEKILEVIEKQRTAEKSGAIKAIKKIVKDNSRKKAKIDKDSKSFFKSAVDILKTLTSGNETKIETLSMYINANQPLNDGIQDKIAKGESLTPKEIEMYNDFLAYEMFNNIDSMTLEEVMDVYNGLNSNKKEAIQILKDIKSIESKKRVSEAVEATEQIKKTNPELFDENGNLLDSNQIKAKRQEIYEKFKALKIPEAISDFVNLFKFGGYTFMIRNLKNEIMNNLETLTNIADRTTKGLNLFREKIYDRLNVMNTERLRGLDETLTKINSIADNIGIKYKSKTGRTFTGYKAVQTTVHTKGSMKIKGIVGSSGAKSIGRFGASELMTIYAHWRNADVKKKLIEQGFTDEKIKDIEKHLGKDLIAFIDGVIDFLSNEYHQGVNEVYSEVNYNNLRAIENYFPLAVLADEKDSKKYSQLINDSNFSEVFNTETAPYFKARNDKETDVDLTDIDFFTKFDRYINTMEEYKAYAKGAKNLHSFFEIPAVKTLLKNLYIDKPIRSFVLKQLAPNSMGVDGYKGYAVFRGLMSNLTRVVLGFKAVQIVKQAISFVQAFPKYDYFGKNYKGEVPAVIRRRADLIMFLIDGARMYATLGKDLVSKDGVVAEAIELSPDFKERWTQALKGDVYSLESGTGIRNQRKKFNRASRGAANLAATQGAGTTVGDVLGVLGYMINYKRNIANGMNKSDALRILNDYNSTQQTRRETERTKLQGEKNPLIRTFLMFGSAIFAQQNKISQSTRNISRSIFSGQIPKTEDVRSFVINAFLVNILFETVSNIFRLIDGDDEDLEEVMNSIKEIMVFTKQAYAFPLIGSALEEMDAGGRAIAKLDYKFYEKPKYRSEDVVNPFMIMYRRAIKNADSDRSLLYNSARPLVEGLTGFNADPFIGGYNYFSADDLDFFEQEQEFLNMIGVTPSYQPNRLKDDVREKKFIDESIKADSDRKKFYEIQGRVKAATGKEGREGEKREGTNTRDEYR